PGDTVDPIVAVTMLLMLTTTIAAVFLLVRNKGRNGGETLLGIALGWLLFVSPIYFFGDMGAITGIVLVFVVGGLVAVLGSRYDRQMRKR
ncbi:MAG: hypothetical protein KC442_16435, partial [Thermomicrobiales bacterium]|nr:hypothetical protein [Thermomicrobiales bacterium]